MICCSKDTLLHYSPLALLLSFFINETVSLKQKIEFYFMKYHKKNSRIKMKNRTVVQLTVIATERSIRGYYKLGKAELIHALEATKLVEQN